MPFIELPNYDNWLCDNPADREQDKYEAMYNEVAKWTYQEMIEMLPEKMAKYYQQMIDELIDDTTNEMITRNKV